MSSEDEALSSSMTLSRSGGSTASTTITSSSSSRAKRSSGGNTNANATSTTGTLSLTQSLPSSGHRADNEEDDDDDDDELYDDELDDGELDESYNTTESSLVRVRPARSRSSRKQAKTANRRSPVDSHAIHQVTSSEVQDRPVRKLSLPGLYAVCGAPASSSSSSSSSSGSSNASAYNIINTSNSTETHLATPSSSSTTTSIISPRARVRTLTNTELTKSPELPANSRAYSTSPPDANKSPGSPQRTYKTASMSPTLYDSPKRTADKEKFRRSKGSMSGATLSHIDTKTLARGLRNSQRLKKLLVRESDLIISQPSGGYSVADKTWRETYVEQTLMSLLGFAGCDDKSSQVILQQVQAARRTGFPMLLSDADIRRIHSIQDASQQVLIRHEQVSAAITIQSAARTFLIRRRLGHLFRDRNEMARVQLYNRKFMNLVHREQSYMQGLVLLMNNFVIPLSPNYPQSTAFGDLPPVQLSAQEHALVFSTIEEIFAVHSNTQKRLLDLMKHWPVVTGVGELYLNYAPMMEVYGAYVRNFDNSQSTLQRLKKDNPNLARFLERMDANSPQTLHTLLSMPINHISKLCPLHEELALACLPGSQEQQTELHASNLLFETSKIIREELIKSDTREAIANIERRIIAPEPFKLFKRNRVILFEGQLTGWKDSTTRKTTPSYVLFLFNDLLLITKPKKKSKAEQCKLLVAIHMRHLQLVDEGGDVFALSSTEQQRNSSLKPATYHFYAKDMKDQWMHRIQSLIHGYAKDKIFGVPLAQLLEREKRTTNIPLILEKSITQLRSIDPTFTTEGLFRVTGDISVINHLKDLLDASGMLPKVSLGAYRMHDIAGVLKLWLRELPEPLMSWEAYDAIIAAQKSVNSNPEQLLSQLPALLAMARPEHMPTIAYLFRFLHDVSANSQVNMMTTSNLAVVFGPIFARPEVDTIETSLNSPLVNMCIKLMIENCATLLGNSSST